MKIIKNICLLLCVLLIPAGAHAAASNINVSSGDAQFAVAGSTLPLNPTVIVTDAGGAPVAGIQVNFAITKGAGSITGPVQFTDGSGLASVGSWTLDAAPGQNNLTATASGLAGSPVVFLATGTGPATAISIFLGNNQNTLAGFPVAQSPCVIVKDSGGTGVGGVAVSFAVTSGGGSATGLSKVTDSHGIAFVDSWTVGSSPGPNTLTATSSGLTGSPIVFTANGTAPLAIASGPTAVPGNADTSQTIAFTCSANLSGTTFSWNFGDGGTDSSGSGSVQHAYAAPGMFGVTVTASNAGQTVTGTTTVVIFKPLVNMVTRKSLSTAIPSKGKDSVQISGVVTYDAGLTTLPGSAIVNFGSMTQTFLLKNGHGTSATKGSSFQLTAKSKKGVLTSTTGGFKFKLVGDFISVLNTAGLATGASGSVTIPLRIIFANTTFSMSNSVTFAVTGTAKSERGK